MPQTNSQKGNTYKYKTKKYWEKKGYHVEYLEHYNTIFIKGKVPLRIKVDILGADGCATSDTEFILWGSILSPKNLARVSASMLHVPMPNFVTRYIMVWTEGKPTPRVYNVDKKVYNSE